MIGSLRTVWQGAANTARHLVVGAEPATVVEPPTPAAPEKDWTVLVYMDGRNLLAKSTYEALNKMEQVGSTDQVNLVVQATLEPKLRELRLDHMEETPTRRYYVEKDSQPDEVTSKVVGELAGEHKLSQSDLQEFLKWGTEKYPAKHYLLIVKKHGAGFAKIGEQAPLSARELQNAIQGSGHKMDVVAWDSCLQQQMELAYQIKDQADFMTGSPENVLADVYPYQTLLDGLTRHPQAEPRQVAKFVVEAYKHDVTRGIHSAADLGQLKNFAQDMRAFTSSVIASGTPRDLLYTTMLNTRTMENRESSALQYNFRDLGGFLSAVSEDDRFPANVRETAGKARASLKDSVIAHMATAGRQALKKPTGYSSFFPWKAPSAELREVYGQLDYVKDSGWLEMLDYTFQGPAPAAPAAGPAPTPQLSLATRLSKIPLRHYKKYISGYLPTACQYTPSCSQYAREAVEVHGIVKGGWLSFMRLMSCNGYKSSGADPVPCDHDQEAHHHEDLPAGVAMHDFLVAPPVPVEKSRLRKAGENWLVQGAGMAARMVGGAFSAALCAPIAMGAGAFFGYKAGTNQMDEFTAGMLETHREAQVHGMLQIARPLGYLADQLNLSVANATGSQSAANLVGGIAGPVLGAVTGAVGGAVFGFQRGGHWAQLWGRNITKDSFGELPAHPENDAILARDYAAA